MVNTYKAFYNNQTRDVEASTLYEAKTKAVVAFKVPKSKQHMVAVVLAAKGDTPVPVSPASLG